MNSDISPTQNPIASSHSQGQDLPSPDIIPSSGTSLNPPFELKKAATSPPTFTHNALLNRTEGLQNRPNSSISHGHSHSLNVIGGIPLPSSASNAGLSRSPPSADPRHHSPRRRTRGHSGNSTPPGRTSRAGSVAGSTDDLLARAAERVAGRSGSAQDILGMRKSNKSVLSDGRAREKSLGKSSATMEENLALAESRGNGDGGQFEDERPDDEEGDLPIVPPDPRQLLKLVPGVVKSRSGAVLSRGLILKTDHWASGRALDLEFHLQGAPNFRMADLNIFGSAQPTFTGLKTILSVLKCQPGGLGHTAWFCTREEPVVYIGERPFVLREASQPTKTFSLSDRAENLEGIEMRLKLDILKESARFGGVILVQEEIVEGEILPTWIAADAESVKTVREVWESVADEGYSVDYYRVPVTSDQRPEDNYLDAYVQMIRSIPIASSIVINCGMGVVRTTYAMAAALLVRRRQLMLDGQEDPFEGIVAGGASTSSKDSRALVSRSSLPKGAPKVPSEGQKRAIANSAAKRQRDRSLMRLMHVLQKSIAAKNQQAVIELFTLHPGILDNLRAAVLGEYDIILSLVSILDGGSEDKSLVDAIIDHCDAVINLREDVLNHRIRYATSAMDEAQKQSHMRKALAALERYFFLLAFSGYVQDADAGFELKFSSWLQSRSEIKSMVAKIRKPSHLTHIFAPIHDLSFISSGRAGDLVASTALAKLRFADVVRAGGQVVGDEWADQIVHNRKGIILRAGMILKSDQWHHEASAEDLAISGAMNFRRVEGTSVFALSQPTQDGIQRVLGKLGEDGSLSGKVTWINLREEPLIYILGMPYVLRLEAVSLRNMKSYAGISSSRLELLEDRLKSDILAEIRSFDGRILLHTETPDGTVVPVWESVTKDQVKTLREVMDEAAATQAARTGLDFKRIPITAEKAPDFADISELVDIIAGLEVDTSPVVVNCQLGRGRSTLAQILVLLIQRWMRTGARKRAFSTSQSGPRRLSYQIINNLLRVIKNGQEVKVAVDSAIEQAGEVYDLLESIETSRQLVEEAGSNQELARARAYRGMQDLRRYFFLIVFAAYLNDTEGAETGKALRESASFEDYVKNRPVIRTIEKELDTEGLGALVPLERAVADSGELSHDIRDWVAGRSGRILSAQTILKSDFFSNLQKASLPERVQGVPNFRRARLLMPADPTEPTTLSKSTYEDLLVFGTGMPTVEGMRHGLEKMGSSATGGRTVYWTSMREEPVLYVNGRPHVLRLLDAPLENVITTGVTTSTVEAMEAALKRDLIAEAESGQGRVLLHDEVEEDGKFTVTAEWQDLAVASQDIMTPRDVFELMQKEGFKVNYERLPVTDEQAPIPGVFSRLEERVTAALRNESTGLVFNCQMGRGRTTTGMVAACLIANIVIKQDAVVAVSQSAYGDDDANLIGQWDERESDLYIQGEYKVILQLVGVLQHGKLAKKLADRAIDAMEGVQNLRKAIYDFKVRADSADSGSKKQRKILDVAVNYLYRYGSLITFANYLLERADAEMRAASKAQRGSKVGTDEEVETAGWDGEVEVVPPFPKWLDDRREIGHILSKRSLD